MRSDHIRTARIMGTLFAGWFLAGGVYQAQAAEASSKPSAEQVKYLDAGHAPKGEGWVSLFNGKDLSGWHKREDHNRPFSWKVVDGVMTNAIGPGQHGTDIVSDTKYEDFELYYEYRIPAGSNSGMYLRGRYEIQILDDSGKELSPGSNGGIWATAAPSKNVSRKAGEWQSAYTKIEGKTIKTVVLNGVEIHKDVNVPKATGGHLDEKVDEPGPIMIQGDHGAIEVRCVLIRSTGKYLDADHGPRGEGWIALCNGKDLTGWHKRESNNRPTSWQVVGGVMVNQPKPGEHGVDIVTDRKFGDFELYYEYRIPAGSNSGMYLRGRYEIQIIDDHGRAPDKGSNGGLYGVAAPSKNVSRPAGEWQSVYAKIAGKKVTVVLNGTKTVDGVEVTRPTGGELDNKVDEPGPIMIQGDHGLIEVRNLMLRPIKPQS